MTQRLSESDLHLLLDEELFIIESPADAAIKLAKSESEAEEEVSPEPSLVYQGDFNSHVAILFSSENEQEMSSSDQEFLFKILSSVNLTKSDVAVINIVSYPSWQDQLDAKIVLDFSKSNADYSITEVNSQKELKCDPLAQIASNVELKRKLWNALKSMFTV